MSFATQTMSKKGKVFKYLYFGLDLVRVQVDMLEMVEYAHGSVISGQIWELGVQSMFTD